MRCHLGNFIDNIVYAKQLLADIIESSCPIYPLK